MMNSAPCGLSAAIALIVQVLHADKYGGALELIGREYRGSSTWTIRSNEGQIRLA